MNKLPKIAWHGNHGSVDASECGWKPGVWPKRPRFRCEFGGTQTWTQHAVNRNAENEITSVAYTTGDVIIITVFND